MTVRTIYQCDKCGKEQGTPEQFWNVGVFAHTNDSWVAGRKEAVGNHKIQVCRLCLESFGIYAKKAPDAAPIAHPTTEELIREIVERSGALDGLSQSN